METSQLICRATGWFLHVCNNGREWVMNVSSVMPGFKKVQVVFKDFKLGNDFGLNTA